METADPKPSAAPPPSAKAVHPPMAPAPPESAPATAASPAEAAILQPRVYKPGDIACCHQNDDLTNCGAEPGEPCVWQQPGMEGTFHAERIADAAAASHGAGKEPTVEEFDQAAWDTGLF